MEINTKAYWEWRFGSGDWEAKQGRLQTASFARAQLARLDLPRSFSGTLLDFGCGLGDAIPLYKQAFPDAKLLGADFSTAAIARCKADYGHLAAFFVADHRAVPRVSVIVASNVLEHVKDDLAVLSALLGRCDRLYIFVPYRERLHPGQEHIHSYDEASFQDQRLYSVETFLCRGWSQFGMRGLWWNVYAKNAVRPLFGRPIARRARQIMFSFGQGSRG
ncbi:MAG: class I SAM-dependent methyltransferase [Thermoanaerobaculia bacterium]